MLASVVALFITVGIIYLLRLLSTWRQNYTIAKGTGLPIILLPALPHAISTRLIEAFFFPFLRRLPSRWIESWLPHLEANSMWNFGYSIFSHVGFDTYLLVAPGGNVLVTCSPDAITQILHRREDFPRPVELFRAIGVWGPNLATSEGVEWRRHRKIVARAFGDHNNREVWTETLYQAPKMIQRWISAVDTSPRVQVHYLNDLMHMSMHIISKAGFGHRMSWEESIPEKASNPKDKFGLSYAEAGRGLAHSIMLVIGLPDAVLRYSPFTTFRNARKYNLSFKAHMSETIDQGLKRSNNGGENNDILHCLLRNERYKDTNGTEMRLTGQEILADSFVLMQAGHETTGTTMQMGLIYLALDIGVQKRLQEDLDRVIGRREPRTWSYEQDLPRILEGTLGAVMMEVLRLAPPVPAVAKLTAGPLTINFDGLHTTIPGNTLIALNAIAAHRNPNYWPRVATPSDEHSQSSEQGLAEFRPERWLPAQKASETARESQSSPTFFQPRPGAYFPFSEGPRSCLGRRFSQIEFAVVVSVILQHYSIELDCREYVTDEDIAVMTDQERQATRNRVEKQVKDTIQADMCLLTTMLLKQGSKFPIRLVRRGEEQFF